MRLQLNYLASCVDLSATQPLQHVCHDERHQHPKEVYAPESLHTLAGSACKPLKHQSL